ncbi:DUF4340 domain-containing protein [Gracilibacillus sp. D59]|uniref:DUF4340 domain-containing protein n=1 Tax=Gracilibacillus sp. D59 TaxID=3457434 RepID=UPI003FCDC482
MKKTRTLIYVIISIIVLSALLFILVNVNQNKKEADGTSEQIIESFEQVTDIQVFASENVTLTKKKQGWQVVDAENEVDTDKMESFLLAMEEMTGEAVEVDKKNVNLDFPKVTVSFADTEGNTQKISVGQMNGQGDRYYVEQLEKEKIYLVDRSSIETIPLKRTALLDTKILTISAEDVTGMEIDNGTEVIQLSKESPYSEKESLAHLSGWYMHEPYQNVYSVAFSKMQEMVVGIDKLEQVETVNGEGDYGFTDSDFSIEFSNGQKQEKLIVGDPAANNQYYVQIDGKQEVYKLPTKLLDPYSHQAYDMIDRFVHIVSLNVIDELSIKTPEDKVTYTMEHEETNAEEVKTTVFHEGEELNTESFRDGYKQLAGLTFDEAYNGEAVEEEPEVTITYLITDENNEITKNTIEFSSISDTHYAIMKNNNNQIDFTVQKDKLHQALEWMIQAES